MMPVKFVLVRFGAMQSFVVSLGLFIKGDLIIAGPCFEVSEFLSGRDGINSNETLAEKSIHILFICISAAVAVMFKTDNGFVVELSEYVVVSLCALRFKGGGGAVCPVVKPAFLFGQSSGFGGKVGRHDLFRLWVVDGFGWVFLL